MQDEAYDEDITYPLDVLQSFEIKGNKINKHKTLRVNFTTYDMRRGSDFIKTSSESADIMVLSGETEEAAPFWYARVLGIHSVVVARKDKPESERRIEFLRIRWFGQEDGFTSGDKAMRLDRIGFIKSTDTAQQYGLMDPSLIVRRAHIIPTFALGHTYNDPGTAAPAQS